MAATTTQAYYFLTALKSAAPAGEGDCDAGRLRDRRVRLNAGHESALAESSGGAAAAPLAKSGVAVLNAGISGNRVLHDFLGTNALARFDRDVLVQTGVQYVIVLEGNADILIPGLIGNPRKP